jgi:deoxyribonuclease V
VVVLRYPGLETVETAVFVGPLVMPYVPGLLSFRELPLILPALERLTTRPNLLLVDGQGVAHPRRLGIAAHLGLITGLPAIGCAKSRLCGTAGEPGPERGSAADLIDRGEIIGRVVRTRFGCRPVYVSVGHRVSLETAVDWVLKLGQGFRLPEPVRLAHLAAGSGQS